MADAQAEGPVMHKRILVGGPPSDLPDKPLAYPGKPLAHRFIPTEAVRRVEETKLASGTKLATDIPFKPIARVAYPDKNIHLAPVSNVRPRGLQPIPLSGSLTLPTSNVGVFELSEELRRPLEARFDRLTNPATKETPAVPELKAPALQKPESVSTSKLETTHSELEDIKKLALKELEIRQTKKPSGTVAEKAAPAAITPSVRLAFSTQEAPLVAKPAAVQEAAPTTGTEEETRRLLSEAERLESELSRLRQGILVREEVRTAPTPTKEAGEVGNQTNQLTLDKAELLKKVDELSVAYNKESAKRAEAENKLATLNKDQEQHLQEKSQLESKVAQALAKQAEVESKLENLNKGFEGQLQRIALEKGNLADQLKNLEGKGASWQQKESLFEKQTEEVAQLRGRLATTEKERHDATEHLQKLEVLIEDIRQRTKTTREPETVVKPQIVEPEKPPESSARIIRPQAAIGKMAPSLTSAPNVINGIVKDTAGMLLSNVIIVVKDGKDEPVRALKTNKIGQFAISTPLPNGTYTMELESSGKSFDIIQVEVKGKVMPPIEIRANN